MKLLITVFTSLALMLTLVSEANAKRFGGGGFGKSFSSTPYKKPAPNKSGDQQKAPADQTKTAPGGTSKGLMGGMLGGLLAGGLFAYLLGSGAFEGIQFMDILLLALVGFVIFKLMRGMQSSQGLRGQQPQLADHDLMGRPQQRQDIHPHVGSAAATHRSNLADHPDDDQVPMVLPEDFDTVGFIQGAVDHYKLVQQAWNEGNMTVIAEYVAPELLSALETQRADLRVAPKTEVIELSADIVRADARQPVHQISLLFRGLCRDSIEKSEDGIFDTWHLERDTTIENAPWIIVGIEAE